MGFLKQTAKLKHVQACSLPASQYQKSAGFDDIHLINEPTAGLSLDSIDLGTSFLGHALKAPLMIAPMTGGMELGALLNQRWAKAAEHFGLAFGVGSQRLALTDPRVAPSFKVRALAPNAMIFANLGAAQLLKDGVSSARAAIDMIEADAIFIHLNPLQEACQEHGDRDFRGFLSALEGLVYELHKGKTPVLVREVGFGLSERAAKDLIATGIAALDCAGAGGTSWTKVEGLCADDEKYRAMAMTFGEWGIPTVQSIRNVRRVDPKIPLIATGGLRNGLHVAKALALGADLGSMAQPMLLKAIEGEEALFSFIEQILQELAIAMFAAGAQRVSELSAKSLL